MNPEVCQRLLQLNDQFYQTFASQFSATRQRIQPGVRKIMDSLPNPSRILDLGCGNGEFTRQLMVKAQRGKYIGLDNSPGLIQIARQSLDMHNSPDFDIQFFQADLVSPQWEADLADEQFDVICAFAVFHHLPGQTIRGDILTRLARRLAPGGVFIHSEWQFLNSPRLRERILPWATIGLANDDVEQGDYLLDWRSGGVGYRYVHHFSSSELQHLAGQTGFQIIDEFNSDGEGDQLGLYQIWRFRDQTSDYYD